MHQTECFISLIADDDVLCYCISSIIDMITLQNEMCIDREQLRDCKLTLNVAKTKFVIFGFQYEIRNLPDVKLSIFGQNIEQVNGMKCLGVLLDQNAFLDPHIEFVQNKATQI